MQLNLIFLRVKSSTHRYERYIKGFSCLSKTSLIFPFGLRQYNLRINSRSPPFLHFGCEDFFLPNVANPCIMAAEVTMLRATMTSLLSCSFELRAPNSVGYCLKATFRSSGSCCLPSAVRHLLLEGSAFYHQEHLVGFNQGLFSVEFVKRIIFGLQCFFSGSGSLLYLLSSSLNCAARAGRGERGFPRALRPLLSLAGFLPVRRERGLLCVGGPRLAVAVAVAPHYFPLVFLYPTAKRRMRIRRE